MLSHFVTALFVDAYVIQVQGEILSEKSGVCHATSKFIAARFTVATIFPYVEGFFHCEPFLLLKFLMNQLIKM